MLDDIRLLCASLQQQRDESRLAAFQTWKDIWIANNGEIGRKKEVEVADLETVMGAHAGQDPYEFLFSVETAIVFVARSVFDASGAIGSEHPAAELFDWWRHAPAEATQTLAHAIQSGIEANRGSELLRALARDPLREAYHALLPKSIRHTLGAYLSPPDLCDFVIRETNAKDVFETESARLLEPNCGLGAFFCALLASALPEIDRGHWTTKQVGQSFSQRVFGIEKNLCSFVVSRYLHQAICSLLDSKQTENVLWGDSVYIDESFISKATGSSLAFGDRIRVAAALRISYPPDESLKEVEKRVITVQSAFADGEWATQFLPLEQWLKAKGNPLRINVHRLAVNDALRIDRIGRFTHIIGNPPWVNWENIDPEYKALILPSWPPLGLFAMSGRDRAFSKEDLSVLATYSACVQFGSQHTRVGLLVPQALFQSRKNSKGFRRFRIGNTNTYLNVSHVADFTEYAAFGDAKNRTAALFFALRDNPTAYPVRYLRYVPKKAAGLIDWAFEELKASPSSSDDPTSNWALYQAKESISASTRQLKSYRARTGVFTGGANAIYYVKVLDNHTGVLELENDTERAKIKVPTQKFTCEDDFLYPFAKGRDLSMWGVNRPLNQGILLPHTKATKIRPVPPGDMHARSPKLLDYLAQFADMLSSRASLTALDRANVAEGFYALLRVGDYTFAPYKVAWRYISRDFCCAVVGPSKIGEAVRPTILQEKLISIAFDDEQEAHFVCGYLSATRTKREIERRIVGTQVSVHVIEDIDIPQFDASNVTHREIAELCITGHQSGGLSAERLAELDALIERIGVKGTAYHQHAETAAR